MSTTAPDIAPQPLAVIEISALGAALVVLDAMEKTAGVRLVQAELNDYYGYVVKVAGDSATLRAATTEATRLAEHMQAPCRTAVLDAPDRRAWRAILSPPEHQPLIEQDVVFFPTPRSEKPSMSESRPRAIGLIETQGFTAVIEAIDTACKAANVEVLGKEKLGGGYITVLIQGDVAAVKAAVEAGRAHVEGLGKLIAAHVIANPSDAVLALLPR